MNSVRAANPRRLAFFGAVILLLSLALIFMARDIIREAVVLPLSYLVWVVGVFLDTTPQIVFWISALFFALLAAYRSLVGRRKVLAPAPPELAELASVRSPGGQVAYWALRVHLLRRSPTPYFTNAFHQSVNRLLLDGLAHRYRLTTRQVEEQLREGLLDVPSGVRDYALDALRPYDAENRPFFADLWARIMQAVRAIQGLDGGRDDRNLRGAAGGRRISMDEEKVRLVVSYLEQELEVSNDDADR